MSIPLPQIEMRPLSALKLNPRNARTHSKRQVKQVAASIRAFGFTNPILVDADGFVLAGECRAKAAKQEGLTSVPTLILSHLSEAQRRAYVLADNKLATEAGWDRSMLAQELGELAVLLPTLELDWTIETTGFARGEIEVLTHDQAETPSGAEDAIPAARVDRAVVTQRGDIWQLGAHRVGCGDARSESDIERLMDETQAAMVFTDPPYNVRIEGHVTRTGAHREFPVASGELSRADYREFLLHSLTIAAVASRLGAIHAVCMDWRHIADLLGVGEDVYEDLLNLCVWNKGVAGQGSFYRSQHELIAIFGVGGAPHSNHVQLGRYGRNRSNVFTYPSAAADGTGLDGAHPTPKPVALVADVLRDCTLRGEVVLDPFLGSGTTLIAAEKVGRVCRGLELDPAYVDLAVRRWQAYSGGEATLSGTSETFADVEDRRAAA